MREGEPRFTEFLGGNVRSGKLVRKWAARVADVAADGLSRFMADGGFNTSSSDLVASWQKLQALAGAS